MKNQDPIDIFKAIDGAASRYPKFGDGIISKRIDELWLDIVGKKANLHTKELAFSRGTLTVDLDSDVMKNELLMRRSDICRRLNEALGTQVVKDIVFS